MRGAVLQNTLGLDLSDPRQRLEFGLGGSIDVEKRRRAG